MIRIEAQSSEAHGSGPVDTVRIADRLVGSGQPCFVIAEIGVNHNGDPRLAQRLIAEAAAAGADAVKFQTFSAARLTSASAPKAPYQLRTTDAAQSQAQMLESLELPRDVYPSLVAATGRLGMVFLSTPFDEESADLLEALDVPAFKIASPDLTNHPLLCHVAAKRRPMIVSTGAADLSEVAAAVALVTERDAPLVLLHCVSAYPARPEEANLRAISTLAAEFGVPAGFSDHTVEGDIALGAVALGACVLEKHLTLDRALPGPDHAASLPPHAFAELVRRVRSLESAMGDGVKRPQSSELELRDVVRRSLAARGAIPEGTVLEAEMLVALRPGTGISPSQLADVVGRRTLRALRAGELLDPSDMA